MVQWGALTGHLACFYKSTPATALRPRGTHLGASETPAPAELPFAAVSMAALSSACAVEGGAALAADREVGRRLVLRAPLPQRRRLAACEVHVGRMCADALAARP